MRYRKCFARDCLFIVHLVLFFFFFDLAEEFYLFEFVREDNRRSIKRNNFCDFHDGVFVFLVILAQDGGVTIIWHREIHAVTETLFCREDAQGTTWFLVMPSEFVFVRFI